MARFTAVLPALNVVAFIAERPNDAFPAGAGCGNSAATADVGALTAVCPNAGNAAEQPATTAAASKHWRNAIWATAARVCILFPLASTAPRWCRLRRPRSSGGCSACCLRGDLVQRRIDAPQHRLLLAEREHQDAALAAHRSRDHRCPRARQFDLHLGAGMSPTNRCAAPHRHARRWQSSPASASRPGTRSMAIAPPPSIRS